MAENIFKSFNAAIADKQLILLYDHIESFIDNREFDAEVSKRLMELENFISDIPVGTYVLYMTINIDDSYNCNLTFSSALLWYSLYQMLGCESGFNSVTIDTMEERIKKLKCIETEEEFKKEFPYLYKRTYTAGRDLVKSDPKKCRSIIEEYENMKYNHSSSDFEKWKNLQKNNGIDIETVYNFVILFQNFRTFRNKSVKYFESIIGTEKKPGRAKKIENWIKDHPIKVKLKKDEQKKLLLYIMNQNIELVENYLRHGFSVDALRNFSILDEMLDAYDDMYPDDMTEIRFYKTPLSDGDVPDKSSEEIVCNINLIYEKYYKLILENPLFKPVKLPEFDKTLSYDENMKNIDRYLASVLIDTIVDEQEHGAKDATEEVHQKLEQLEEDLKSDTLSDKEIKEKAIVLKKLNMVLNDIKPKAIQTGTGKIFRDYYVYYYDNGMVAVDRVDGYGALYIMPVNIYKVARYKNLLGDVKNIPGVKSVSHKNKDWLNIAKNYIMTGTDGLTEKDMKEAEEVASIDFPYTLDGLEKLQKQLEEAGNFTEGVAKETKRRAKKIKEMADIDKELKDNEFDDYSDMSEEKRQLLEILDGAQAEVLSSDEIDQAVSSDKSFDELYEDWKKNNEVKKKTRNPVVAGITKRRAMVDNNYCCEWCGSQTSYSSGVHSHHIKALSKGGVDNIYNTASVCPSCHAYFHSGESKPIDEYRLLMITKEHIIQENPEYLPQFNELLNGMFKPEEQEKFDEFYTYEWNYINYKTK